MDDPMGDSGTAALASAAAGAYERLLVAVEAAGIGTWEWRADGDELTWCPRTAEIAGLPDDPAALAARGAAGIAAQLVAPGDLARIHAALDAALAAPDARFAVELPIRRVADGELRHVRVEGRVLTGDDGTVERAIGALSDLTSEELREAERRRLLAEAVGAQQEAEAATRDLESVLERMHDAVLTLDRDWRIVFANDACVEGLRLPRERILGSVFWELFPDGVGGTAHRELHQALELGEPRSFEAYYEPWDDTTLVRAYPTAEGLMVFSTNVTATRRALRTLEERERELRLALSTARLVRWEWDVPAQVVRRDAPGAALLAVQPVLTLDEFVERVHPDDREHWREAWQRAVETGDDLVVEYRILGEDGRLRWVVSRGSVTRRDAAGRPLRLAGVSLDATPLWQAESELRTAQHRLSALSEANVIGVAVGSGPLIEAANDLYLELIGRSRAELEGAGIRIDEVTAEEHRDLDRRLFDELFATGTMAPFEKEYERPDGTRVPALVGAAVLDEERREWMAFALDLTERRRAEEQLAALQRLTAALARALTRRQIARACLEAGADALGAVGGTFVVHDPARHDLELVQWFGHPQGAFERGQRLPLDSGTAEAIATARRAPVFAHTHEQALRLAPGFEHVVEEMGIQSFAALPLAAGDRVLGVLTFTFAEPRVFEPAERETMRSIAELSAQALLRGLRYEAEREIAVTLQRSIIPATLPLLDGVELEAAYLPAGESAQVGGDWYDVFPLGDDLLALVIGDVAGKGVPAASAMAQFRNALRAYAVDGLAPSAVLERLNRLSALMPDAPFATLQIAYLSRATGDVRYASAGHPPAAVRTAGGDVAFVEHGRGTPIGAGPGSVYAETALRLAPGDLLVLYTDGLVERRERPLDSGFASLAAALAGAQPEQSAVTHLLRRLVPTGRAEDDVAILAARFTGPAAGPGAGA